MPSIQKEKGWIHIPTFSSLLSDSNQRPRDYKSRALANWAKEAINMFFSSLLSDSNQRPRDYKSRALANWAKEAGGQACHIAPLQPTTFAAIKPWRIRRELAVWDLPMLCLHQRFIIDVSRLRVQRYTYFLNLQYFATKKCTKIERNTFFTSFIARNISKKRTFVSRSYEKSVIYWKWALGNRS